MSEELLPAAFQGAWVRLRPVARSDHPQMFAQRIGFQFLQLHPRTAVVPSFEQWEATELAEMWKGGPVLIVENNEGAYQGLVWLHRQSSRDRRGYLEFWLSFDADEAAIAESFTATLDYVFGYFNLRKVHVETIAAHHELLEWLSKVGFKEEVRLKDYRWHPAGFVDQVTLTLDRPVWDQVRERLRVSMDVTLLSRTMER